MDFVYRLNNKRGSELVEASISLPLIILTVFLLIRLFCFCIQIVDTSVQVHCKALKEWDSYSGIAMKKIDYSDEELLVKGGVLQKSYRKSIDGIAFLFNEDCMVRTNEVFKEN